MVAPTLLKAAKNAGDRRKLHSRRTFTETSRLPLSSSIRGKLISAGYTSLSSISSTDLAREAEAFEILKMANQVTGSSSLVNVYNTGRLLRLPTLSIFPEFSPLSALMNSSNLSSSSKPAFSSFSQSSRSGGRGRGNERDNDRRRPQGRGGGGGGRGGGGGNDRIDALGRLLTRILRHMATEMRLDMRGDGFVKVEDLLNLNLKTSANVQLKSHTVDEIREAVRMDNKQRFSLVEEDGELLIRANQGHSITTVESDKLLKPILSPEEAPVCVHGTYKKNLESILASGLKHMNRLHVHFSRGLPTDGEVISGMRRDVNVLIFLDIKKALEDGIAFYISDNKVILTEGVDGVVPVDYFHKIESWPSRQPIPF
ncbi:PREDICTED: tRNA 2'-phosphotransferase 1-like [Brassica oleracea var. oleracea]|uniref:tRNA 2'-phosphotransferase 1-like n=1 Tax=Brassica oleracea var. oleracea TaxID=109376 RepID=UPI0006A7333D|nr:PREDICTED: tRNA 2'-phosphotransferase 1-like [Brassica oleracea var. oleracea]